MTRLLLLACLLAGPAWAISDPSEALPDPTAEARAVAIGKELRCLVCQNESIEDSGAELARDLRKLVREQVGAGRTDAETVAWVSDRYGDFVRLRPPVRWGTALLWGTPVLVLAAAGWVGLSIRRRPPPQPLDDAERARLTGLLEP